LLAMPLIVRRTVIQRGTKNSKSSLARNGDDWLELVLGLMQKFSTTARGSTCIILTLPTQAVKKEKIR
jgi:hypothetical protein